MSTRTPVESTRLVIPKDDLRRTDTSGLPVIEARRLRRADDKEVRDAPDAFVEVFQYVWDFEFSFFNRDTGELLRKSTNRIVFDRFLPLPGPTAESNWTRFWEQRLRDEKQDPWDVSVERTEDSAFRVRASMSRSVPKPPQIIVEVPPQPAPIVNVEVYNPIEPLTAEVQFKRDPAGQIESASILEEPQGGD